MTEVKEAKKTPKKAVDTTKSPEKEGSNSAYGVFTTGGKQYRVKVGDKIKIEKIVGEYKEGDKVTFDQVLLLDDGESVTSLGTPFIKGSKIEAKITKINRYKTVEVVKYKAKSRYFKRNGHRQPYFEVEIASIK